MFLSHRRLCSSKQKDSIVDLDDYESVPDKQDKYADQEPEDIGFQKSRRILLDKLKKPQSPTFLPSHKIK